MDSITTDIHILVYISVLKHFGMRYAFFACVKLNKSLFLQKRGNVMKKPGFTNMIVLAVFFVGVIIWTPAVTYSRDSYSDNRLPEGVYIKLTKDFYEALQNTGTEGVKTYSNDPSNAYLKEIAVSARFLVETNLQILKQQEEIIQLMRSFMETKKGSGQ
jgi:hypothetical protein